MLGPRLNMTLSSLGMLVAGVAAAQAGPPLRGGQALEALKQQGAYEGLRVAYEAARYQAESSGRGGPYRAGNRAQGLEVEFGPDGIRLKHREGTLQMRLAGYGYGERWKEPAAATAEVQGNRVEYGRGGLREWYVNEARGLEQGFTLGARPGQARTGEPLVLALKTSGDLRPVAEAGGAGVEFRAGQQTVLRYSGLRSWDARGRLMPSRLEVRGLQLRIVVEDEAAEYPLTVDPAFTQQAKLTASDGVGNDSFGYAVALSGDTALVGAYGDDGKGSAYVFVRSGTIWSQQAKLTASDRAAADYFGWSVALSGDTALVGAHWGDNAKGSAYVFVRSGATWSQQAKLTASENSQFFGISVALSGDTALVGAHYNGSGLGAAYVFVRSGATWSQQAKLTASDGIAPDFFGISVALSGDTALVGADGDDVGINTDQGSAYVFVRSGAAWSQQAKLTASDGAFYDQFGHSVALSGDTALVGAWGGGTYRGSAYVFVRSGATWSRQAMLTAPDSWSYDQFGRSVALSGDTALVGAMTNDVGAYSDQGAAYVFARSGATWSHQEEKVTASDGTYSDYLGISVALSGDTALVGAFGDDNMRGSAYVFVRSLPLATLSPPSLNFGNQGVGTTSPPQTVTLTNSGGAPLIISSVTLTGSHPGDFIKTADTCAGATIAPGNSCAMSVAFAPTAPAARTAALTIFDNAADSPQNVPLSGTAATGVTSTTVASSLNPSTIGQSVTFTAQVTGSGPAPTGTVVFRDGAATLATAALAGGTATFATSSLTVGSHSITAAYSGDASNVSSTSAVLVQTVNPTPPPPQPQTLFFDDFAGPLSPAYAAVFPNPWDRTYLEPRAIRSKLWTARV